MTSNLYGSRGFKPSFGSEEVSQPAPTSGILYPTVGTVLGGAAGAFWLAPPALGNLTKDTFTKLPENLSTEEKNHVQTLQNHVTEQAKAAETVADDAAEAAAKSSEPVAEEVAKVADDAAKTAKPLARTFREEVLSREGVNLGDDGIARGKTIDGKPFTVKFDEKGVPTEIKYQKTRYTKTILNPGDNKVNQLLENLPKTASEKVTEAAKVADDAAEAAAKSSEPVAEEVAKVADDAAKTGEAAAKQVPEAVKTAYEAIKGKLPKGVNGARVVIGACIGLAVGLITKLIVDSSKKNQQS
ncbi:MAG: hypothetical protein PHC64_07430 [Candidatus Gastranaerophilales bacterium]|nr:hypothetical protein [Candidatus Gastranaerophilales bacterium]